MLCDQLVLIESNECFCIISIVEQQGKKEHIPSLVSSFRFPNQLLKLMMTSDHSSSNIMAQFSTQIICIEKSAASIYEVISAVDQKQQHCSIILEFNFNFFDLRHPARRSMRRPCPNIGLLTIFTLV